MPSLTGPNERPGAPEDIDLSLVRRLADIGISLSAERDINTLLEKIVSEALSFTNADGATLYLVEDGRLSFCISKNISLKINLGGASGDPVDFEPVPMDSAFVSAYAAINRKTVNIPDVYSSTEFDFTGPKRYDERTGYRSVSMLVTPMMNHEDEVIGVLQLLNALDPKTGDVIPFDSRYVILAESLASQAAVAITNMRLIKETERLFESFLQVMVTALDARSKYTHGHVRRVAGLALELAKAVNEADSGPFSSVEFSDDELNELRIAGWMHDIGKIVTPQHVMDKSVKLETIFDRAELVRTRYELILAGARADYLEKKTRLSPGAVSGGDETLERKYEEQKKAIEEERDFVLRCNNPGEFMDDGKLEKLREIASRFLTVNGHRIRRLSDDELKNLSIRKGSITEEEREIMNNHINVTIQMLGKIPFIRKLANVPLYAGSHHECLDGSGYPKGLSAEDLPIQSRILALADFFEALTASDRPYKKPMPVEKAYSIVQGEVDKGRIDGDLFRLFREKDVYSRFIKKDRAEENFSV